MYHKRNTHDSPQSRNSLEEDSNLQAEFRQNSTDDVKSFVIVNDIDMEEELSKAQKDKKNFFQVLSMNFYGKIRSHSFDNRSRSQEKSQIEIKTDLKSTFSRKGSGHNLLEKKNSMNSKDDKQKAAVNPKKKTLPVKGLQIANGKPSKTLASPKESSRKISSPKTVAKKNPLLGNLTAKASVKRDPLFLIESHQKPQLVKKGSGDRQGSSPDAKAQTTGQLNAHLAKKTGLSKLLKGSEKIVPENIEEKVQTLSVEPSTVEIKPIEFEEIEVEKIRSSEASSKESKLVRKGSSGAASDKANKEKGMLSSLSARILTSPVKKQSKTTAVKEVQKTSREEKLTKLELSNLHELDVEQEKRRKDSGSTKNQATKNKKYTTERSPDTAKHSERTPVVGNGMGYQGMKIIVANKGAMGVKDKKKAQSKEINLSALEGKKTSFDQSEDLMRGKKNSTGRLEVSSPWNNKKGEDLGQARQLKTPKFDGIQLRGEKSWKILDVSDKMTKKDKNQPTSPASGETRKVLNFFDKLASIKRREKK